MDEIALYAKYYCRCYGEFTKRARICPLASGIIIALPCNRLCNLRHYELSLTPSSDHPRADSVLLVVYLVVNGTRHEHVVVGHRRKRKR